jgi:hypothetical protein
MGRAVERVIGRKRALAWNGLCDVRYVLPLPLSLRPLKGFQRAAAGLAASALACAAHASDLRDARYDAATDTIVVEVAYQGTNPRHEFSVQWGKCAGDTVAGRLVDSQWNDKALEPYRLLDHVSLEDIPCRPARVTLLMGRTGQATFFVPAKGDADAS